jgi:hypothetical protein
MRKDLDY